MTEEPSTSPDDTTDEKIQQTVTVQDTGPARKQLTIEIPEDQIQSKIDETYKQLNADAFVPGFRRGRAPRRLIERRFGSSVRSDVKDQLISASYNQAIKDQDLKVIGDPDLKDAENLELPQSGSWTLTVEVEVPPQVTLIPFDKLKLQKTTRAATDQDVKKEIELYRQKYGSINPVEGGKVKTNDFVQAKVQVLSALSTDKENDPIIDEPQSMIMVRGKDENYKGQVAGILVDDLGKQLTGKATGAELTIATTGPPNHEEDRIKNQSIRIEIQVNQIFRSEPAPVDRLSSLFGVESNEQLNERVRSLIEERFKREQQADLHRQICEQLTKQTDLELPEGLTSRQTARGLRRRAVELAYDGTPQHEIEQQIAELRSGSETQARNDLKLYFILNQAAQNLEVEVTDAELNGHISLMAAQQNRRPEKLRQELQRRGELESVYSRIRELKTLDRIVEHAQIEEMKDKPKASKTTKRTSKKKTSKSKVSKNP